MHQERGDLGLTNVILSESRLAAASVKDIANFFNKAVETEHLKSPNLKPYKLFNSIVDSSLSGKIPEDVKRKALEAMLSENADARLAGKTAFLWLSMRRILATVDSVFVKGKHTNENREEMLDSAIVSVMGNASSIDQKSEISNQVGRRAQLGILSYLHERDNIIFDGSNKQLLVEVEKDKNSVDDPWEKIDLKMDLEKALSTLLSGRQTPRSERRSMRQKKVLELKFGLGDGVERTNGEVGKEFNICREEARKILEPALRRLGSASRRGLFTGYH